MVHPQKRPIQPFTAHPPTQRIFSSPSYLFCAGSMGHGMVRWDGAQRRSGRDAVLDWTLPQQVTLEENIFSFALIFRFSYPLLFEINQFDPLNITLSNFFSERVINKMGVIRLERVTPTNLTVLRDINLSIFPILTMDR